MRKRKVTSLEKLERNKDEEVEGIVKKGRDRTRKKRKRKGGRKKRKEREINEKEKEERN